MDITSRSSSRVRSALTHSIAGDQVTDCVDLLSIQEEADTRIILHALHANEQLGKSSVKGRIIIKCSDTDVLSKTSTIVSAD
jgi:hypothetical protein